MDEKKKRKRAARSLNVKVVESGRVRTAPRPEGIEWEEMSDGSYRYWLLFSSASKGRMLKLQAWPVAPMTPTDL